MNSFSHFRQCAVGVVSLAAIGFAAAAMAQDTRAVGEPKIPRSCIVLSAQLTAVRNKIEEPDESKADTDRIQNALNNCKQGMAVELRPTPQRFAFLARVGLRPVPERNAFLSAPLQLREGVTLLIDQGATLYASRNPKDYETTPGLCGIITHEAGGGCRALISATNVKNAAIMGDGVIDGRGDEELYGYDYTWWQMAREAAPGNQHYNSARLITANHADGLVLYRITLHNSPNFHVGVMNTNGFTAWGVHILTPTTRGVDARNTDGIDPGSSTNITVARSWIESGDDNIAVKTGVTHMSVLDNHFYNGHGMSIGSDTSTGVSDLLVDGLTLDHTTSGIRIKSNNSRGGLVRNLLYQNICMRDVRVPIAISPFYNNGTTDAFVDPNIPGDRVPDFKHIILRNITDLTPGDVLIAGKDAAHIAEVTLDNVNILGIKPEQVHTQFAKIALGPGGANFPAAGSVIVATNPGATGSPARAASKPAPAVRTSGATNGAATQSASPPSAAIAAASPPSPSSAPAQSSTPISTFPATTAPAPAAKTKAAAPFPCEGKFVPMQ